MVFLFHFKQVCHFQKHVLNKFICVEVRKVLRAVSACSAGLQQKFEKQQTADFFQFFANLTFQTLQLSDSIFKLMNAILKI